MIEEPYDYGLPHQTWRPHQYETLLELAQMQDGDTYVVQAPTGCHAIGQGILMADGSIAVVEDICVGDLLMGPDSLPREVQQLIRGFGPMYRVVPRKGDPFVVSQEHVLSLQRTTVRTRGTVVRSDCLDNEVVDVTLTDWLTWSKTQKHIYKLFRSPVEFPPLALDIPVDPYFVGVLLGGGHLHNNVSVTTVDGEIVQEVYRQASLWGLYVREAAAIDTGRSPTYHLHYKAGTRNSLTYALIDLGIWGTRAESKFIPFEYKVGSQETRRAILAGLLDTDGSLTGSNGYDYISKSRQLSLDVAFVCRSLGLSAYVSSVEKRDQYGGRGVYYRVSISGDTESLPCRIPRKLAQPRRQKKHVLRTGFRVERVEDAYYYGFSLSGDGRYLLDDFTVTHNSGKTSWPAALARDRRVIALSHTKMLQQDNYGGTYDFTFLFGKGNYPCALNPGTTAALCKHAGDPKLCGRYPCAYYRQKNAAMLAARCALNYAYFMTANWPREQAPSGYLVLDECHLLPDLVIEHSSVTVDERTRREWDLPAFPLLTTKGSSLMAMGATKPVDQAKSWLARAKAVMTPKVEALEKRVLSSRGEDVLKAYNKAVELMWSLDTTGRALMQSPDDWFIRSGPGAIELSGDRKVGGFFCKPLTARHHFPSMFLLGGPTILMSATIGNFETFSTELGIQNYRALTVPSQWGPRSRPVYYFEDAPSIGRKTVERDWDKQAELISKMLHAVPTNWAGVIHCTSKAQTYALANRLAHNGLERRIWVPPSTGTNQQLAAWEQAKRDYSGRIAVAWSWWVGVDLLDEKIDILAKTPYPFIGDDYSQARLHFDGSFYLQQTAWQLMQGCGRTRRGRPQDYDRDGQRAGLVAIVDQNWKRVRKYFDADFAESMTAWK